MKKTLVNRLMVTALAVMSAVSFISCGMGKDPTGENADRIVFKVPEVKKGDIISFIEIDTNVTYGHNFIFAEEDEGVWIMNTKPGSRVLYPNGSYFDSFEFSYLPEKGTILINDIPALQLLAPLSGETNLRRTNTNTYYAEDYTKNKNPGLYQKYTAADGSSITFKDSSHAVYTYPSGTELETKYSNRGGTITFRDSYFKGVFFYYYDTGVIIPATTPAPTGAKIDLSSDKKLELSLCAEVKMKSSDDASIDMIKLLLEEGNIPSVVKTIAITDTNSTSYNNGLKNYSILKDHPEFDYELSFINYSSITVEHAYGTCFNDITTLVSFYSTRSTPLEANTFKGCSGLKEVTCRSITTIEAGAFNDTALENIDLTYYSSGSTTQWRDKNDNDTILQITDNKQKNAEIVLEVTKTKNHKMSCK